jgi:hypothetical protein
MATETSANGVIKVGSSAVAEVTGYSINYTSDTVEDTAIGDTARTYKATLKSYTASIDVMYDQTDTSGQLALDVGTEISYSLYPSGETSGDVYYSGTGIITGRTITGSLGEMITASFEIQGSGDLTESSVA